MKKSNYACLLTLLFLMIGQAVWAQKVSGVVSGEEDGQPIPGVSVIVKGTAKGTITDIDGKYDLSANVGETVVFTLIGYTAQEIVVAKGVSTLDVSLKGGNQTLGGEVVVTALNIKQDKRALGYNVQTVAGEDLASTQRDNFMDALQGRVAGLMTVPSSGGIGSSSLVILRGVSSIGGNNQPLIVVDGLPIDNTTFNQGNLVSDRPNRDNDYLNRAADINPNDIASVTILKGPEAAALYGSQGSSGAILITTKKGTKGRGKITYDNAFGWDEVYRFPKSQNTYTRGLNGVANPDQDAYFGPKKADSLNTYDNLGNFFQTGTRQAHNISIEGGGTDRLTYRLSGNYTTRQGIIPNTDSRVVNTRLSGTAKLLDNLDLTTSLAFTNTQLNKPITSGSGFLTGLLRWPFYDDVTNFANPDGSRRRLQPNNGNELDNPFYLGTKAVNRDVTNRFIANNNLVLTVAPWLSLTARFGLDNYGTRGGLFINPESSTTSGGTGSPATSGITDRGSVENFDEKSRIINGAFLTNLKKKFGDFSTNLLLGGDFQDKEYDVISIRGANLYDPGFNSINNTNPINQRNKQRIVRIHNLGAFAKFDVGYKDLFFLSVTGRNDWSSTLPVNNRSYFYPAGSLSFNFSELPFLKEQKWLSYGKFRYALSKSGKDAPAYKVQSALAPQTTTGGGFIYDFFGGNPDLRPEFVTGNEAGVELKFFKSRLSLDVTYFQNERTDQIATQRLSYGTGFIFGLLNSGSFQVRGWEVQLGADPIKTKNFSWNISANFTQNKTSVLSLPANVSEFYNSDTWLYGNARASAFLDIGTLQSRFSQYNLVNNTRGAASATAIGGASYWRNKNGDILVNPATGLPVFNSNFLPIGDRNPDFMVGIINRFNYKNLSLSFNLDLRKGGDVFNGNEYFMFVNGLSRRYIDRETPVTFKGILRDGKENTDNPTVNNIQVTPQTRSDFFTSFPEEAFVEHDINWLRIRDVSLTYKLPASLLKSRKSLKNVSVFVTGTELFMWTNYTGADPAVNGNSATSAGVGAWGFDFGKTGTPRSISAGIKIGLE